MEGSDPFDFNLPLMKSTKNYNILGFGTSLSESGSHVSVDSSGVAHLTLNDQSERYDMQPIQIEKAIQKAKELAPGLNWDY